MQKRALIAMQYSALHHRTWKTPTVQKPCSHGLQNKKAMKSFGFTAPAVDIPTRWNPRAKQQQRVALADFSAAPWQGFEKSERGPNNSSLFQPQAAVVVVALWLCLRRCAPPPCSRSPPSHKKKNQHTMCTGFWCSKAIQIRTIFL